jgi:hypothetical protein
MKKNFEVGSIYLHIYLISITSISIVIWALITIVVSIFYMTNMPYIISVIDFNSLVSISVSRTSIFSLVLFVYVLMYRKQWIDWVPMDGILELVAILNFVPHLIFQRRKGTYRDKLAAQAEADQSSRLLDCC